MSSRRLLKAAEAIRGVVSMAILTELRDPRVQNVTVVGVEVTPDMREAKVIVSVMGSEAQQRTVLKGLQNSVGFLQSKIADRIETRYIPRLSFVIDDGVKKSVAVQQILEQIAKERAGDAGQEELDDASIDEILDELGPDGEFQDEESQEDDQGKNRRKN
ncbi:MAG: 30S ribosome-binding factor RbfA [Planctomycetaceae bacterium]|jgi:ribosome-binding factor A|nr:30S ribosome-binding factor RbfA [Planctomycetaceae bacterium]MCE2814330.1 30S ribosome-binding factor RbfA [Planctomycetaceae bacterium]